MSYDDLDDNDRIHGIYDNLCLNYDGRDITIKCASGHTPVIIGSDGARVDDEDEIFSALTFEIDLRWVPDLSILVKCFPKNFTDLLCDPPKLDEAYLSHYVNYAMDYIGRWKEIEPLLLRTVSNKYSQYQDLAWQYAVYAMKDRWPEAEPYILNSRYEMCYVYGLKRISRES